MTNSPLPEGHGEPQALCVASLALALSMCAIFFRLGFRGLAGGYMVWFTRLNMA